MTTKKRNDIKMVDVNDVRDINQTVFLHLIRENQPISRADIAKLTDLRPGTVSAIVNRLIKKGLVYEGTDGPSSGGRPPKNLFINAETFYVLAVDIGVVDSIIAVGDFNGRVLSQRSIPTDSDPNQFINSLADNIKNIRQEMYTRANFGAIGISVPGLIDRASGSIKISPNLEWENVPLSEKLYEKCGLPVIVENDANAAAFSEIWYGRSSETAAKTLLFVLVVEGLGTGLILNGELHIGSSLGLGGFGHMSIDPNGELCSCGRRGCWETFASERATVERFHRVTARPGLPLGSLKDVINLAYKNDEMALESINITAEYLGEGISNLIHGIFPETVVIGGNITEAWSLIEPIIRQRVHSRYLIEPDNITIRPATVQRPSLYGAIPIAIQECFKLSV